MTPNGILHERELEQPGSLAQRRDHPGARRFELLHLGLEVGEREAQVIDHRPLARLRVGGLGEGEDRLAELDAVWQIASLRAEMGAIPLDGFGRLRRRQVDVVVGLRRRAGGDQRHKQERAGQCCSHAGPRLVDTHPVGTVATSIR